MNGHISVFNFFLLFFNFSFKFVDQFNGVVGGHFFFLVLVDEVVIFFLHQALLSFDGGETQRGHWKIIFVTSLKIIKEHYLGKNSNCTQIDKRNHIDAKRLVMVRTIREGISNPEIMMKTQKGTRFRLPIHFPNTLQ